MKLYTLEQLRKIYDLSFYNLDQDGSCIIDENKYFEQSIEKLAPIELPSDEEIKEYLKKTHTKAVNPLNVYYKTGFESGAIWMKEQILGKEDKTFKQKSKWTEVDNMTRLLK